jgi:hypothetical protein
MKPPPTMGDELGFGRGAMAVYEVDLEVSRSSGGC